MLFHFGRELSQAFLERNEKLEVRSREKADRGGGEVFVNGDSLIPNAKALEPLFKARSGVVPGSAPRRVTTSDFPDLAT